LQKALFNWKKVLLLHPQQRRRSSKYWQEMRIRRKEIFKKKIRKSLRDLKMLSIFAPRKTGKFIEGLGGKLEKTGLKKSQKKL